MRYPPGIDEFTLQLVRLALMDHDVTGWLFVLAGLATFYACCVMLDGAVP